MSIDGIGLAALHEGGGWRLSALGDEVLEDLDALLTALRRLASDGGAVFAAVAVDDEFFALVRPIPGGAALLLSDATACLDYDLAADICDLLDIDIPEEDLDEDPWPAGDLAILADFGLTEQEMQIIVDDEDLYPDEQLQIIADRCGFGDRFAALVDVNRE